MIQIALFVIWAIAFVSWLVVNVLTYRQLVNVIALRKATKWWFVAQVVLSLTFFAIAFISIIFITPLFETTAPVRSGEFF